MPGISDVRSIGHLGDYIREQRASSQISLRQLAKLAGVSNPYLSQIERGLRKPSAEILQQIAKGLRVSAEAMYVQAGILEHREGSPVVDAVLADSGLTERQKQVLLEIHESFRKQNAASAGPNGFARSTRAVETTGRVGHVVSTGSVEPVMPTEIAAPGGSTASGGTAAQLVVVDEPATTGAPVALVGSRDGVPPGATATRRPKRPARKAAAKTTNPTNPTTAEPKKEGTS